MIKNVNMREIRGCDTGLANEPRTAKCTNLDLIGYFKNQYSIYASQPNLERNQLL